MGRRGQQAEYQINQQQEERELVAAIPANHEVFEHIHAKLVAPYVHTVSKITPPESGGQAVEKPLRPKDSEGKIV